MAYTVTQRDFNNVQLSYIVLYDNIVIPEMYLADFEKTILHQIFTDYPSDIQLGLQETIAPNGQTMEELLSGRTATRDEYISRSFSRTPSRSRYFVKTIFPPATDVELALDPSYDFTEIGVAMLDQNDNFVSDTNANAQIAFSGSSSVNGFLTGSGFSGDDTIDGNNPAERIIWEGGLARIFATASDWNDVFQLVVIARQYDR